MTAFIVALCCAGSIYALGVSHGRQRERERVDARVHAVWDNHAARRVLLNRAIELDRRKIAEALERIDMEADG